MRYLSKLNLKFEIQEEDGLAKTGRLETWKKESLTPIMWFGLSIIESVDFQLNVFSKNNVEGILCNAYDLIFRDKGERKKLVVDLSKEIAIKCDSGGFQNMNSDTNLSVEQVYNIQKEIGSDICVQLDYPLFPLNTEAVNFRRIDKTLKNLEELLSISDGYSILPTIHGYNEKMINYSIKGVIDILGEEPNAISIGSLVPLVSSSRGSGNLGGKKRFVDILISIRNKLPNTFIHVLGIGGTMSYIAVFCGADSLDFVGWVQKAGYGCIQLPGVSDRFITRRKRRKSLEDDPRALMDFLNCLCPACREHPMKDFEGKGKSLPRLLRAMHNVYVYQSEIWRMRKFIREGYYYLFVNERLRNSSWRSLLKYASEKIRKVTKIGDFTWKDSESILKFINES